MIRNDEVENITEVFFCLRQVITYFSKKLEKENEQNNDVNEVLEKVQRWSHQWPRDLLKVRVN